MFHSLLKSISIASILTFGTISGAALAEMQGGSNSYGSGTKHGSAGHDGMARTKMGHDKRGRGRMGPDAIFGNMRGSMQFVAKACSARAEERMNDMIDVVFSKLEIYEYQIELFDAIVAQHHASQAKIQRTCAQLEDAEDKALLNRALKKAVLEARLANFDNMTAFYDSLSVVQKTALKGVRLERKMQMMQRMQKRHPNKGNKAGSGKRDGARLGRSSKRRQGHDNHHKSCKGNAGGSDTKQSACPSEVYLMPMDEPVDPETIIEMKFMEQPDSAAPVVIESAN